MSPDLAPRVIRSWHLRSRQTDSIFFEVYRNGGRVVGESDPEEQYRTCPECGADCEPEPFHAESGIRIAFSCADHGVHSVVEPFGESG